MAMINTQEKSYLRSLFDHAAKAADSYDGSSSAADALLTPLTEIDTFVMAHNDGQSSLDLEKEFAKEVGIAHPKSVWDIIDDALASAYQKMRGANSFDDLLAQLERAGTVVVHTGKVLVKTDDGQINTPTSDEPKPFEIINQPRLAWLIEGLQTIGEHTDHIIIRVGTVDPNMVRQKPYVVIELPDRNKQIAVCDQFGEITFVSDTIIDPESFSIYTKNQLKSLPMMHTVRMTDPPSGWLSRILDIVQETPAPEKHKRLNLEAFERTRRPKPLPLSEEIILEALIDWHALKGIYPTKRTSDQITNGPLTGSKWSTIHSALKDGLRGLPSKMDYEDYQAAHLWRAYFTDMGLKKID